MLATERHKYYYKAKLYYKLTFFGFIWIILFSQVYKVINPIISAVLLVLPVLGEYVIVSIGLICIIKSYTNREPFQRYRLLHLIGYLFFAIIQVLFILSILGDIRAIVQR
jgi:hypothetical protein